MALKKKKKMEKAKIEFFFFFLSKSKIYINATYIHIELSHVSNIFSEGDLCLNILDFSFPVNITFPTQLYIKKQ